MPFEHQDITWAPVQIFGAERQSRWLVLCDHASNVVPPFLGPTGLGVTEADLNRHIAYDIGAAGVALKLADRLGAPAILSNFSRLVIDPNRGEDDPTLVRRLYDETIIPGNRHIDADAIEERLNLCYRPYHDAIEAVAATRADSVIVSVHSFTRQLRHKPPRPWHVGLLFADDTRLSYPLAELLRADRNLVVGMNEPYSGFLPGDTIDRHALRQGRQNTLIEIRSDLIEGDSQQTAWSDRLSDLLPKALDRAKSRKGV